MGLILPHLADPVDRQAEQASESAGLASPGDSGDELDRRLVATTEGSAARKEIARQLIAGQLTLTEAIDRFLAVSDAIPEYPWEAFRESMPGDSLQECLGRQVVIYVLTELRNEPERARQVAERLESELADLIVNGFNSSSQGGQVPLKSRAF
jgi:hypothetical protein